jgi:hypothetical protein
MCDIGNKLAWQGSLVVAVEVSQKGDQERAVFAGRCVRLVTDPMVQIISPTGEERWFLQSEVRKLDAPLYTASLLAPY